MIGCVNLTLPLVLGLRLLRAFREHESRASFYAREWRAEYNSAIWSKALDGQAARRNYENFTRRRMNKYNQLRAAIAAIRRNNRALLAVLPQWRCESGDETAKDNVTAFFRERGKEALEDVAAFLDAMAKFSFDEFPRDLPELWRMVYSAREIQWRLRRHFPGNAFFDSVFYEEIAFFKALLPTAGEERGRAYWELLRKVAGYSRRVLSRFSENVVRSLEGEKMKAVCLADIGDLALKKIAAAMGGEARRPRQSGRTGGTDKQACRHWMGGTVARTRRGGTDREGRRGRQTEYMEKQRKVFLDFLKIHPETASARRQTRALECWRLHRREWESAAKKGIGYSSYKALANASLM